MSETIQAKELQLVSIFNDNYRFEIPDYQRPYAWTTEQTGALLDDLLHAIGDVESVSEAAPYFLGSIVTIKNGLQPQAQIVDGQQRLTTLTVLLCVLRELASSDSDRNDTHNYIYAPGRESAGIQGHYRLTVRERDREFFQNNIQQMGRLPSLLDRPPASLPDSQKRMLENARYLYNALAEREETLRKILTQFLAQRCYLVVVSASDQNSAYRIFSVLNDRGLDLSPTDILKSDIIGALPEDIRARHTEIWEKIEEDLGRDRFSDLFAHIRTISMKRRQRETLQQEFQDYVLKEVDRADFIDKVLGPYADAYATVTGASYEGTDGSEEVNKYLRYLNLLNNFDWIPPAMAFYRRNQNPEAFLHFIRDLERLAYALFILRAYVNRRTSRYADVLRAIHLRKDLYGASSPLQLSSKEIADVLSALDGPIYTRSRVPRTLLLRLDSLLADRGVRYEHSRITVEHVLPRNPERNSQWLRDFPDEEKRKEWTDRLANLVLLSRTKNIRALNYDFVRKKKEYFQRGGVAPFALTMQVLAEDEWTPAVLQRRQRELINALKQEWRLDGVPPAHVSKEPNKPAYTLEKKRQEHPRAYEKWPPEDDERLKEMYAAGHGVAELAKRFERNNGAIRSRLKKLGLAPDVAANPIYEQTRQLVEQGLTLDEVARRRGRPKSTIVVHLERLLQAGSDIDLRPLLPPDRFEQIRTAFKQSGGTLISAIKDILGDDYSYEESRVVQLHLQRPQQFVASFNRPNLSYAVLPKRKNAFVRLAELLQKHKNEPVIIYRTTRKDTEYLASLLRDNGFNAQHYHAGMEDDERHQTQENFMQNRTQIIVATIAFGLGIDKSNVRLIVHYDLPKTLEGYYQETGRAGRDGLPSDCVLFYSSDDVPTLERFIKDIEDEAIRRDAYKKLEQVIDFCLLRTCRRRYLLRYFGEEWPEENCGGCDLCLPANEEFDATAIAHRILSAVIHTGERFGITHVAAVLQGSGNTIVKRLGHDALSVYGTVNDYSVDEIKEIAGQLVEKELLRKNEGKSSTLSVTHTGRRFLRSRTKLVLTRSAREGRKVPAGDHTVLDFNQGLFEELRGLRRRLAAQRDAPPNVIIDDVALQQMAYYFPQSLATLSHISGMTRKKRKEMGEAFIAVISSYARRHSLVERRIPVARKSRKQRTMREGSTYEKTRQLWEQGLSVEEIAIKRNVKKSRVVYHLQRLIEAGSEIDLRPGLPPAKRVKEIRRAIRKAGGASLSSVNKLLGDEYPYYEIKIVWLFLRQQGELPN